MAVFEAEAFNMHCLECIWDVFFWWR